MAKDKHEIYDLQTYIFKQLSALTYDYTTMSTEDKTARALELILNWIACEMEKYSIEGE